ncbi:hypothetical protein XENOCAPTIV_020769 [Xenoophorus captivus]|uniref:Transmembrane protein n=1 Tax=Xenoophorus captivus TaxID=1517983 RepID=A0ABV0SGE9_9TELE
MVFFETVVPALFRSLMRSWSRVLPFFSVLLLFCSSVFPSFLPSVLSALCPSPHSFILSFFPKSFLFSLHPSFSLSFLFFFLLVLIYASYNVTKMGMFQTLFKRTLCFD